MLIILGSVLFCIFPSIGFAGGCTCGGNGGNYCYTLPEGGQECTDDGASGAMCCDYCGGTGGCYGSAPAETIMCPAGTTVNWSSTTQTCTGTRYYGQKLEWKRSAGCCNEVEECSDPYFDPWKNKYVQDCGPVCIDQRVEYGSCVSPCTSTAPSGVTLNTPGNGEVTTTSVPFSWNATAAWGNECTGTTRSYNLCVGTNATNPCTGGSAYNTSDGTAPLTNYTATVSVGTKYWNVKATNKSGTVSPSSEIRSFCVEGFDVANPAYVSNWTACDANHEHARTCREDCGTDDCAGIPLTEDCLGEVRGTIFNASDYSSCPAFDPATGYLTGLPAGIGLANRSFGFSDQSSVAPHPWSPLSATTTDSNGNYAIRVYAPANYGYDFSALSDIYEVAGGPKLTCNTSVAVVPSNPITCLTQPCSVVNNMSFGFWRIYSGWWQAVGGSVYGDDGIRSEIPSGLPTEMSLILPDTTIGNRVGFLAYGVPRPADMLGSNPSAQVSYKLWEKESKYGGQVYDWSFYDKRFNLFAKTVWTDGQAINYDDAGAGYQIFKSAGSITSFGFNPTGTQKTIFHVNGDIRITGNITVPNGAFLAVIAKGTITFDPGVTRADGWYVGANIAVPCLDADSNGCDKTDSQFLGNGSFIGWSGIALGRNRGALNNLAPSEKFAYRTDIYNNAPKPMKIYTRFYKPFVP